MEIKEDSVMAELAKLRPHFDKQRTEELQSRVAHMDRTQLDRLFVGDRVAGTVLLLESQGEPNVYLEQVLSAGAADSIGTLYHACPLFTERQSYLDLRRESILILEDFANAGVNGAAVWCPVRGRVARLRDLSLLQLAQLMDSFAKQFIGG